MTSQPPSQLPPETREQLVAHADEFIDRTLDRMRQADGAVWEHQAQMGRTLITLAAGGIVASVSVTQLFLGKAPEIAWRWLVPMAWILWTVSLLAGISREGWMGTARATAAVLERKRWELRQRIRQLRPNQTYADYEKLLVDAFTEAEREPSKAVKVHQALNQLVFWSFAGGIIALVVFAIRNLPF